MAIAIVSCFAWLSQIETDSTHPLEKLEPSTSRKTGNFQSDYGSHSIPGAFLQRLQPALVPDLDVLPLSQWSDLHKTPVSVHHKVLIEANDTSQWASHNQVRHAASLGDAVAETKNKTLSTHHEQLRRWGDGATPKKPCWTEGRGIVVVITRSVVTPLRRPMRLHAIAETWGHDLVTRGVDLIVLSSDAEADCSPAAKAAPGGINSLPYTCISPPSPIDLIKDKAAAFQWIVRTILIHDGPTLQGYGRIRPPKAGKMEYFMWCNDHTFIVASNFVSYVSNQLAENGNNAPIYAGKELYSGGRLFNSGAAGILLSRTSTDILVKQWDNPGENPECFPPLLQPKNARPRRKVPGNPSFGKVNEPGLLLADCMFLAGVLPNRTRDDGPRVQKGNSTQDRFHAYGPQRLASGDVDQW